jgi:acyl-coenzyme A thioesterase PaaI-like protein
LALDTLAAAREVQLVAEASHPFDEALTLTQVGDTQAAARTWIGRTHPAYQNMVGPYGGLSAAQALQAVVKHPALLGQPVALTVNFAAAIADGEFTVVAQPTRTNRSTQHWSIVFTQRDAAGTDSIVLTATAMTAVRRQTYSAADLTMPDVPKPSSLARSSFAGRPGWFQRYDMRFMTGNIPEQFTGAESDSLTQLWVKDDPARPLDFTSLAAMCDVFFPRVWLRRATPTPAGTVTLTSYFHVGADELAAASGGFLLAHARGNRYFNGYFDQSAQLWSEAGALLATSHQLVYYKE